MKIGFVGTGTITEAMVKGMLGSSLDLSKITVSPRNGEIAARLAASSPLVEIGADNQAVVDAADILFLAIRPQISEEVTRGLRFRAGQSVVSVIAATDRAKLEDWIDAPVEITQAIPLPFVAERAGVTAIYPGNDTVAAIFSALGSAVACETRAEYDLLAAASSLMATYFGILDRTTGWLADQGMPADKARAYLAPLFLSLAQQAVKHGETPLDELKEEFSTKGGLNEQVFEDFDHKGGSSALIAALDRVLARIKG
ncbi:pyrroline-5-carboxylate reductase [Rhizobium sp.]|jgi:pyrroline-5-carboxylate reductase|uniref:pyrroline-5-carboxylate reductase n=1 Tax=Rhizobium sp. TaxID=391 RepID=UPI000DD88F80